LYWADLDPVVGTELGRKVRPVAVVSVDQFNQGGDKVVVVPSTTVYRDRPTRVRWTVPAGQARRDTYFCCEDIRAISTYRLQGRIGSGVLPAPVMDQILEVLWYLLDPMRGLPTS
jgi:mRNA interferase MazF